MYYRHMERRNYNGDEFEGKDCGFDFDRGGGAANGTLCGEYESNSAADAVAILDAAGNGISYTALGLELDDDENEIENFSIEKIGPKIENHKIFPEKCNVTIAKIVNKNLIKVKVWERGAGLTKACGTAACATAFAGKLNNLNENKTDIEFQTGKLSILIDDRNSIHMKGPVSEIKEIEIKL